MSRRFLALLLAGTMFAGVAQPARAEPISLSIAAFAATQLGGIVVSTAISVATSFGASLLKNMFAPTPSKPKPNLAMRLSVAVGSIVAQSFIMGDWATAGSLNYRGSWGTDGGTPNAFYVEERILSDKPMRELTGFWYGPQKATILFNEPHAEMGWPIAEARKGGADHMWVRYRDGLQTTADPYLRAKFGTAKFPYTADMIGRGRAVAIVTRKVPNEDNRDLFPANLEYKFETSGIDLYDLSQDSTAGGFGNQRWDDQSTWRPSGNTAVQVYNILRGIRYGDEWMFGLQTLAAARAPASSWIAGINECNVAMGVASGGAEPQFRTGAEVSVDMEAAGVIDELLAGASGRIAEVGGVYKTLFGAPGAAVMSFTDRDIVVTREQGYSAFPRIEETFNGVRPKFVNPAIGWELDDAPAKYPTPEQLQEDGGRELMADVTIKTVNSITRTQRLVKAAAEAQRRWRIHQLGFAPIFSELEPLDAVSWTSAENGYENKKFLVTDLEDEPTYLQGASLQEWDPADYDYDANAEEQPGWSAPIGIDRPPVQIAVAWDVDGGSELDGEGRARRPYVLWTWDGSVEDVRSVAFEARYREGPEVGRLVLTESTDLVSAGTIKHVGGRLFPNAKLEGRIKYLPRGPRATDWTGWLPFDLPDTRMSVYDINDEFKKLTGILGGAGSLDERFADIQAQLGRNAMAGITIATTLRKDTDNAKAQFIQQISVVADGLQALVDYTVVLRSEFDGHQAFALNQFVTLATADQSLATSLNEVRTNFENNAAAVGLSLAALSTADTNLAQLIGEVAIEVDGVSASGLFKMEARSAPAGVSVRLALMARKSVGDGYVETGFLIDIFPDNTTRIVWKSNSVMLLDEVNGAVTAPFTYSAGQFYMSNVVIDGAYIKELSVGTFAIANGAVTGLWAVNSDDQITITSGTEGIIQQMYIPASGDSMVVECAAHTESQGSGIARATLHLRKNGAVVASNPIATDDEPTTYNGLIYIETNPSGATYDFYIVSDGGGMRFRRRYIKAHNGLR